MLLSDISYPGELFSLFIVDPNVINKSTYVLLPRIIMNTGQCPSKTQCFSQNNFWVELPIDAFILSTSSCTRIGLCLDPYSKVLHLISFII